MSDDELPPRPWLRIQGPGDASTMWYAVLRRSERGIVMGQLVVRHSGYRTLLSERGWTEVPIEEIGAGLPEHARLAGFEARGES